MGFYELLRIEELWVFLGSYSLIALTIEDWDTGFEIIRGTY